MLSYTIYTIALIIYWKKPEKIKNARENEECQPNHLWTFNRYGLPTSYNNHPKLDKLLSDLAQWPVCQESAPVGVLTVEWSRSELNTL